MSDDPTLPFEHPLGLHPRRDGGFQARLWAPNAAAVAVVLDPSQAEPTVVAAEAVGQGVWLTDVPKARHGQRYELRLDGTDRPDPWSRHQPDGCQAASALVDPAAFGAVTPGTGGRPDRPSLRLADAVIYELHVGCFSTSGDFAGVIEHLGDLAGLGVTHLELMPVNEFPGDRGWGYDGIFWSAAHHAYGGPEQLVALVDAAHRAGLGVILDVVYNHIGPTGDQIYDAHGPFLTDRHSTPWGRAINVDGPGSGAVTETILQNATWWIDAIGVDGLRVDACHAIVDQSARPVLARLTERVHAVHPGAVMVAESGLNDPRTVRPWAQGGWGFDADWADDFHHALRTLLTDDRQGWYGDFGHLSQLAKAFDRPYVHDGTWSPYRGRRFGAPAPDIDPCHFVVFDQDHDQVGNRPLGDRLPAGARPLAALCVLASPFTPMLFMGEEYGEDAPFLFFSDHRDAFIADATRNGRRAEFADFTSATGEVVPDPQAPETFERSRLTRRGDPSLARLYRQLLAVRPRLAATPAEITFDEAEGWLYVSRGTSVLVANFSEGDAVVPCPPGRVEVATHPEIAEAVPAAEPHLRLPARSGALTLRAAP